MKKLFTLVLAVLACAAMCIPAMAVTPVDGIEHCYYNYICNKSVNPVTADGVYNEDEWSDAVELVINKDTLEDFGRWQCAGEPLPADEFSCTYKFKWDEKYFYVLEVRTDAHYVSFFDGFDYDARTPWCCDGTAIFFCDNAMPDSSNRCDIKFYSYVEDIKAPSVYIGNGGEAADAYVGPSGEQDCTYGGSVNDDTIVFELKMPWQIMADQWHLDSEIAEGTVFRFTPIIMSRDTIDDYNVWDEEGSSYRQMNFHDCVNIPEEGVSGAEDPAYWAALTLSAAGTASAAPAFGVQEATGNFGDEVAANLFDNDETTKWCFQSAEIADPHVIWNVENAINVSGYELVTANDNEKSTGRNPDAWILSGSNDGENWTVIANVEGDTTLQDVNFTPYTFAADAAGEYSWFKFEIKHVVGESVCQLSGLNLLSGEITVSAPAEEAPVEEAAPAEEVVDVAAPVAEVVAEAPAAPQTFDAAIIAAVAAVVSLAGYAVSKKH